MEMKGMPHGMDMPMPQPPPSPSTDMDMGMSKRPRMYMTFFWGKEVDVLFAGFPGNRGLDFYLLALAFVFLAAILVEALSAASRRFLSSSPAGRRLPLGLAQTAVHAARTGVAYLVMLATMSFNGGVLLAAVAGHALGFLLFSSCALGWSRGDDGGHVKP